MHVNDFMIVGRDPKDMMEAIQAIYAVKTISPPWSIIWEMTIRRNKKVDGALDAKST
jgi:hypothetical protein